MERPAEVKIIAMIAAGSGECLINTARAKEIISYIRGLEFKVETLEGNLDNAIEGLKEKPAS
jgi:hypothetical protein